MKNFGAILIFFGVLCILCGSNEKPVDDLQGTKWISVINEGYVDTLFFSDSTYISYSVELGYRSYGTYTTNEDTVKLIRIGDYAIFDNSYHPSEKPVKFYLIKKGEKLYYIKRYFMENNTWIDSNFEFDNYYFTRLNSAN